MRLFYPLSIVIIVIIGLIAFSCDKKNTKSNRINENQNPVSYMPKGVKLGEMKLEDKENNITNKLYFPIFSSNDKKIKLEPINNYISNEVEKYKKINHPSSKGYLKIKPYYFSLYKNFYSLSMQKTYTISGDTLIEFKTINYSNYKYRQLENKDILNVNKNNRKAFIREIDSDLDTMSMETIKNIDICFYNDSIVFSIPAPKNDKYLQVRYIKHLNSVKEFIKQDIVKELIKD